MDEQTIEALASGEPDPHTVFYVEIRPYTEDESDAGFRRMGPMSEHKAERVDRGANINLRHEKYYTRIVSAAQINQR